jgi:hypothetical protein
MLSCASHTIRSGGSRIDNLMKPIQDALQGIAYSNDRQGRCHLQLARISMAGLASASVSRALAVAFSV